MRTFALAIFFVIQAAIGAIAFQEPAEGEFCTPSHIAGTQCHCLSMGGYKNCDPKTKKHKHEGPEFGPQGTHPCAMYCKIDQCLCCETIDNARKPPRQKGR